ncbi:hypothetical protein J7L00_00685 [Candidatus Bathyarchaeota archaeon]|nr:hypothetical protein [Candidatus Bathyarchaeota archaeon]
MSERPYTAMELVRVTGRYKQSIYRKLKELREKDYVKRVGGEYHITKIGRIRLAELHERLRNRLVYDHEVSAPKLLDIDSDLSFAEILDLADLSPPCRYRVKLYVDNSIEEEFRTGRINYLRVDKGVTDERVLRQKASSEELREATVEQIAQRVVSALAFRLILTRLLHLIEKKRIEGAEVSRENLKEALKFRFALTVDYENLLTRESGEVLVALLGIWSINNVVYAGTRESSTVDVLKVLTSLGYGPTRIAELAERIHGGSGAGDLRDLGKERMELFDLCMKILRKHGRIPRERIIYGG